MAKRIVIIQGHPDPNQRHFGHVLEDAYAKGAQEAGHEVGRIAVAALDFPILRSKYDWENEPAPPAIRQAQDLIAWADHLVFLYPLWLGSMPALLKAFLEQTLRPGFAIRRTESGKLWSKLLTGKSARIIVTMGMPAFVYRWYFRAHSLKSFERNILALTGIGPVKASLIGMIEEDSNARRERWLAKMHGLGRSAD